MTDGGEAIGQLQRRLERFRQAQTKILANLEAVYHDFNTVFALFVQIRNVIQIGDDAIDAGTHEPASSQFLEYMQVLTLAIAYNRRE